MKISSTTFVIIAAFCWGLSGGIGGILIGDGYDPFLVTYYRGIIGWLFVLVWLIINPAQSGLKSGKLWFWSIFAGIGVAGNFTFYFISIAEGSVAVAVTLMYSAPVFVYIVSILLKLDKSSPRRWLAIILVIIGIGMLTKIYDIDSIGLTAIGIGSGILAGISYAIFIFGFKNAASHGSPQAILSIAFAVLITILLVPNDPVEILAVRRSADWPLFALLGVLGAGLSFILYIIGLKHTTPVMASIVAMAEPVTASLFGVFILSETLSGMQVTGMLLILTIVTLLNIKSNNRRGNYLK